MRLTCSTANLLLFLASVISVPALFAQDIPPAGNTRIVSEGRGVRSSLVRGDQVIRERTYDPEEAVRVIVTFSAQPLARFRAGVKAGKRTGSLSAARAAITAEHTRFFADLGRLNGEVQQAGKTTPDRMEGSYETALNGVVLTTTRKRMAAIHRLPYVTRVEEDRTFRILSTGAGARTGVRPGRPRSAFTGAGVVLAVLDTGIDYTHPDFGGAMGGRVIGGYDFQNQDADPMDDHGHGTWVAGVAAAAGTSFQGMAPGVSILAYKVCNARGLCPASRIISGLDRALNPDGDPFTDDAVDVINLSLGLPEGTGNDLVSLAVDLAVEAGVVCVTAAGNVGEAFGYHTIGSPGSAAGALTVGATDPASGVASFSARGPGRNRFGIKPELVAPGVAVMTTEPGGGYGAHSGTSLATPLVAGAVAVLLEAHPGWSPEMVKAALMQQASNTGGDLWSQGAGELSLAHAMTAPGLMTPATLSLGVVEGEGTHWEQAVTVTLNNLSETPATYTFSFSGPSGITASFATSGLTIPPGESRELGVTLNFDGGVLPNIDVLQEHWLPYVAEIRATGANDTLRVPIDFVKSAVLRVEGMDGPFSYFAHDGKGRVLSGDVGAGINVLDDHTLLLNTGTYDVVAAYGGFEQGAEGPVFRRWFVVRDGVRITGSKTVSIDRARAVHRYTIAPQDENGALLQRPPQWTMTRFEHRPSGVSLDLLMSGHTGFPEEHFSDAPGSYEYRWYSVSDPGRKPFYHLKGVLNRFDRDETIAPPAAAYRSYSIHYATPPDVSGLWVLQFLGLPSPVGGAFAGTTLREPLLAPPYTQPVYVLPDPVGHFLEGYRAGSFSEVLVPHTPGRTERADSDLLYVTPWHRVRDDGVLDTYFYLDPTRSILPVTGDHITYGLGPSHWFGRLNNTGTTLALRTNTDVGYVLFAYPGGRFSRFFPLFLNQLQDAPQNVNQAYTLADAAGAVIASGRVIDLFRQGISEAGFFDSRAEISLPSPGGYSLILESPPYVIQRRPGRATVRLSMDTRLVDKNPPAMTALNVLADGEFTDLVGAGQAASVRIQVADAEGPVTVSLAYRMNPDSTWIPLQMSAEEDVYWAAMPVDLPEGYVSLRVVAVDASGNALTFEAEPAFKHTEAVVPPLPATLRFPSDGAELPGGGLRLMWNPTAEAAAYHVQVATDAAFTAVLFEDSTVVFPEYPFPAQAPGGTYFWRVRGLNEGGGSAWSSTYHFTVSTATGLEVAANELPRAYALRQNYPNPFQGTTTIPFELPRAGKVSLRVYDLLGREVATLLEADLPPGRYARAWEAWHVAPGVYLYRLVAGDVQKTGKMVLLR